MAAGGGGGRGTGARWYVAHEYKNRNFPSNKFLLYFSGENRITSRSFHKIHKFSRSRRTQTTVFAVFSEELRGITPKTDKNAKFSYVTSAVCKFGVN